MELQLSNNEHRDCLADRELAAKLCEEEKGSKEIPMADAKLMDYCEFSRARCVGDEKADGKACSSLYYEDDEKERDEKGNEDEEEVEDDITVCSDELEQRIHFDEDNRLAQLITRNDLRELHRINVRSHFDGEFAKHVNSSDHDNHEIWYQEFVLDKWEQVEMLVDDVHDGICISLLLPELIHVDVRITGPFNLSISATRKTFPDERSGSVDKYRAEYSFDGATSSLHSRTVEHDYQSESGVLFLFLDKLRLSREGKGLSLPRDEQKEGGGSEDAACDQMQHTQIVKNDGKEKSMLLRLSRGFNRLLSFRKSGENSSKLANAI